MDMKRFFLYFITIAALALAGCGGGGNGMTKADDPCTAGYERTAPSEACMKIVDDADTGMFMAFPGTAMEAAVAIVIDAMTLPGLDGDGDNLRPNSPVTDGALDTERGTRPLTVVVAADDRKTTLTDGDIPFTDVADATVGDLGDGWYSSVHLRTVNDKVDTVVVYNNVEDAAPLAWTEYYTANAARDGVTGDAADSTTGLVTLTHSDADEIEALLELLGGAVVDALPIKDEQTYTFEEDADTMDDNRKHEDSMFNGIPGTVECTSTSCTVVTDGDNEIITITGTWTFTPMVAMGRMLSDVEIPGVDPDGDYLQFGYWVQATGDPMNPYGISTFASGSDPYAEGKIAALMGTAEYSGRATGMFVTKTDGDPSHAGQFTANAELKAYFGENMENMINVNEAYTISGIVNGFEGDGVNSDWKVDLLKARFTTPAYEGTSGDVQSHSGYRADFTGPTTGEGEWRGAFFGEPTPADPAVPAQEHPTGVAGEFNAHFDDGHVIGAFGATQQ